MLTKDLIRCRLSGGGVRPLFIDPSSPELLGLAEQLLAVYRQSPPPARGALDEQTRPMIQAQKDVKIAKGLNKLILDRCEFSHPGQLDYPALREQLFRASGDILRQGMPDDEEAFRKDVLAHASVSDEFLEEGIYADLPENECLLKLRDFSPRQLLERYNVALVQSLLLHADRIEAVVSSDDPAKLRRLFKYLRFFRLLARIYHQGAIRKSGNEPEERLRFEIDGPASIFEQSRRYGLQLASFFPALCSLETWLLDAQVEWKGHMRRLRLDQKSNLVSHYRSFSAYVPDEIKMFHRHFEEQVTTWKIVGHTPFLKLSGQEVVFPDLSFQSQDGLTVHLELFHRWHSGQVLQRLESLDSGSDLPLILGIDRALLRNEAVNDAVEASSWFTERGFLFKDYPTVAKTLACLDAVLKEHQTGGEGSC